jgi:ADP-ribose pyrophosphatase YjhB (NUDIX family)
MDYPVIENSAKAIIIDNEKLLVIHYKDSTEMGLGDWYSLPGGRQRYGETIEEALARECREEIGAEVQPGRLLFIREYIHARHKLATKGRDQHKVEFMFLCSLASPPGAGASADVDQSAVEWVRLDDLPQLQIFPTGLRDLKVLLDQPTASPYWGDVY